MRLPLLTFSLLISTVFLLTAQNLLQNGDFEIHGKLDCINCPMFDYKFSAVIPPWKTINGSYPFICDCQLKKEATVVNDGICDFRKVSPHSGCNMIEFEYAPSCLDQKHETRGCSSYLGTKLSKALEIGSVYEISFWLHILPPHPTDADYARFIGINLYPDVVRNPTGKLLESADFQVDTVIFGRWYNVKWLVRPVCNLQFLVLGVFRGNEDPPVNTDGRHNRFYVDDVEVREVTGSKDQAAAIVPYCRFLKKEKEDTPEEVEGALCFFNSNDSLLSSQAITTLDAFALRAKANPSSTFLIVGRTDNVGAKHKNLAHARIKSIRDYLEKKHGIPPFRFLSIASGTDNPLSDNDTETGRQQNRSVQIQQMDGPIHLLVYRHVLSRVFAGEKLEAFKMLNIWLNIVSDSKKILALFDPRLDPLKSDPTWKALVVKKVRASYRSRLNPDLAFVLDSLGLEDQKCRTLNRYVENMHIYMADQDSTEERWSVSYFSDTSYQCSIRDEAHVQALINLIGNEWPKISEVGERPAKTAFLVVSHTGDTSIIARYLPILQQRCQAGEAEWIHFATLSDRMLIHRGLPQHFGTQYQPPSSKAEKLRLFPLENAAMVNEWRKELGLEPIDF